MNHEGSGAGQLGVAVLHLTVSAREGLQNPEIDSKCRGSSLQGRRALWRALPLHPDQQRHVRVALLQEAGLPAKQEARKGIPRLHADRGASSVQKTPSPSTSLHSGSNPDRTDALGFLQLFSHSSCRYPSVLGFSRLRPPEGCVLFCSESIFSFMLGRRYLMFIFSSCPGIWMFDGIALGHLII